VYCANGRGVFRSIDLSPDWRALGRSAEFRASALALGSSHVYWTTSALQRVPIDGGSSEVIGPSLLSGVDVLGDRVFFASNPGGLAGVYEYSETDGLVSRAGEFTRDVTVIESGLYALDVFGALRWHAFRSAERLLVDESTDPTREEVEADASHVYYLELSDGPSARRSRLLRLANL
jgi:hypothetical protein